MTAYSFRPRFVAPVLAGTKRQTIRAERRRHARPGEQMQLYTGMRTKHCRLIARVTCKEVSTIRIRFVPRAVVINEFVDVRDVDEFARRDGFRNWADMLAFWREENAAADVNEWTGVLLTWTGGDVPP